MIPHILQPSHSGILEGQNQAATHCMPMSRDCIYLGALEGLIEDAPKKKGTKSAKPLDAAITDEHGDI